MSKSTIPPFKIGSITVPIPIVQGGMGVGISESGLSSAVANEGGIGVISSVGLGFSEPDFKTHFKDANKRALKKEIRKAREKTDGLIGVNIMVALSDYDNLMEGAVEENVDFLFLGAGLPLKFSEAFPPERLKSMSTKIIPIVSSAKAVKVIFNFWQKRFNHIPDGVVVEGPMAGGHLGFKREQIEDPAYALEKIVPDVVSTVQSYEQDFGKQLPVIAGGGIYTGKDIFNIMQLGAQGVQMGTRFVGTHECDANIKFKEAYINAGIEDVMLIQSPVGLPGRAIRNSFLEDVTAGIKKPFQCPWKCLRTCDFNEAPYCIAAALLQANQGRLQNGFAFAGSNVWRVNEIVSVKTLMHSLVEEYEKAVLEHNNVEANV
ncbi:nitronate monooxygenase [candidate division KSB1 bacterium]|nr:nitronate monooxygenase [candidate division KSB1 bacterium]